MRKEGPVKPQLFQTIESALPELSSRPRPDANPDLSSAKVAEAMGGDSQLSGMWFLTRRGSRLPDRVRTGDDLKPRPDHELTGRVVNTSGIPAEGVYVVILAKDLPAEILYVQNGGLGRPQDEYWAVTTQSGEFRIDPLCDDYRIALISKQGYGFFERPFERAGMTVELQPWSELTMKRPDGWNPVDELEIWMRPLGATGWPSLRLGSIHGAVTETTVKVPQGRGEITYAVHDPTRGMGRLAKKRQDFEIPERMGNREKPTVFVAPPLSAEEREETLKQLRAAQP